MADAQSNGKGKWIAIVSTFVSFAVGVIFAAYVLGQRTGKVIELGKEMDDWKREWKEVHAPHIERMDSRGTLSFEHFHQEYLRNQQRREEQLKDLDKRVRELERKP